MKTFLLVLLSTVLSLAAAEWVSNRFTPTDFMKPGDYGEQASKLHQPSLIPGLDFEVQPNRELRRSPAYAMWTQITIRTNSYGMRGPEPIPPESGNVCTVAVLGDSFTFGMSIDQHLIYPSILERTLRQRYRDRTVQVLNFGVKAYGTREETLVLEHKALAWNPDLVVIGYYLNDPELRYPWNLPNHFREPEWWQHFNLLRHGARAIEGWKIRTVGFGDYFRYLHAEDGESWRSVQANFAKIARLTGERDIPVVLVLFPHVMLGEWGEYYQYRDLHEQITEEAERNGFVVLDLLEPYLVHDVLNLIVEPGDAHPSPLGHSIAGSRLFEFILDRQLLACLQ